MCCTWKFFGCTFNIQEYFQLFFWFGMFVGLLSPIGMYFCVRDFFNMWPVIQRFFVLLTASSSWLMLVSPVGYFLLQGKISNKAVSAAYSVCLCMVIVAAMLCSAFSQSQVVSMDGPDASVVTGIRDYFDENANIPEWLHELQIRQKCCGFSGPEDWRKLIYPPDKPAIEDVPESCCVKKLVGCNLILDSFHNKSDLSHWIFTDGCRKLIEKKLSRLLDFIAYDCVVIMMTGIVLVAIYWIQLSTFMKQAEVVSSAKDQLDPVQRNDRLPNYTLDEEIEGFSESVTPGITGSDLNSRTSLRTVQFEIDEPGRFVLKKTKSAISTGGNNNYINTTNKHFIKFTKQPPSNQISDDLDEDDPGDRLNVKQINSTSRVPSRRASVGKINRKRSKGLIRQSSKIRQ